LLLLSNAKRDWTNLASLESACPGLEGPKLGSDQNTTGGASPSGKVHRKTRGNPFTRGPRLARFNPKFGPEQPYFIPGGQPGLVTTSSPGPKGGPLTKLVLDPGVQKPGGAP